MKLKRLFQGRLNRRNLLVAEVALYAIFVVVETYRERPMSLQNVAGIAFLAYAMLTVFVAASLTIRRLHDIGRSGWLFWFTYLPVVNIVLAIYTLVKKGEPGPNKYGPPPKPRISLQDIVAIRQEESVNQPPTQIPQQEPTAVGVN
jgi:uncharacterized membrane protein YhaH (DUF805 family)